MFHRPRYLVDTLSMRAPCSARLRMLVLSNIDEHNARRSCCRTHAPIIQISVGLTKNKRVAVFCHPGNIRPSPMIAWNGVDRSTGKSPNAVVRKGKVLTFVMVVLTVV